MFFSVGGDFRWIPANGVFAYYDTNTKFVIEGGTVGVKSEDEKTARMGGLDHVEDIGFEPTTC